MRWLIRAVLALVTLAVVAVVTLLLIPAERIAAVAADRFEAMTGREVRFEGEVSPSLWPELGVTTGPVSLANAAWSEGGPMFSAEGLSIGVDMATLFGGEIRIRRIEATRPRILLERAADGTPNWAFGGRGDGGGAAAASEDGGGGGAPGRHWIVTLDHAEISDAAVSYIDRAAGTRTELDGLDAVLAMPEADGPADIELSAEVNGQPFRATGRLGSLTGFMGGEIVAATADVAAAGSTLAFEGRAGTAPAAEGRLDADIRDLSRLLALAGRPGADLPAGLGERIAIAGDTTFVDGTLNLRNATLTQGGNRAGLSADLSFDARPRLAARISAETLDLSALTSGSGGGGDAAAGDGWSTAPIDVSGLQAMDAEVFVSAGAVDLGTVQVAPFETMTTLEAGRAVTELRQFGAYGGRFGGSIVVNSRGGLSARTNVTGRGIALEPFLVDVADFDKLTTTGDVTLNLLGVGNSMDALMKSLSGDGALRFGAGELRGFDLAGMIRNLDPSYVGEGTRTVFDSITASYTVNGGVLRNDDLAVVSPEFTASGEGVVGIGARTLDYTVTPRLNEGQDLVIPVRISGPWSDPSFGIDFERAAEERVQDEIERLSEEALGEVRERVSEELGLELPEGQSIEDTILRGLEQGLGNLLGGN